MYQKISSIFYPVFLKYNILQTVKQCHEHDNSVEIVKVKNISINTAVLQAAFLRHIIALLSSFSP